MEPHAYKPQLGFDPIIDTSEYRRAARVQYRKVVGEYETQHGPLDQAKVAEIQARLEVDDAKLDELHDEA